MWLDDCSQLDLSHTLLKLVAIVLAKMEIKVLNMLSNTSLEFISGMEVTDNKHFDR